LTPSGGDTRAWAYEAGTSAKRQNREKECENLSNILSPSQAVRLNQRMDEITVSSEEKESKKEPVLREAGERALGLEERNYRKRKKNGLNNNA